jgi:hypothetical protein
MPIRLICEPHPQRSINREVGHVHMVANLE